MYSSSRVALLFLVAFSAACRSSSSAEITSAPRALAARTTLAVGLDSLAAIAARLDSVVDRTPIDAVAAQQAFADARAAYKRIEPMLEYYLPVTAEQLNGPPLDEVNLDEGPDIIEQRDGFQVVEEYLFPSVSDEVETIRDEVQVLHDHITRAQALVSTYVALDEHPFDAARMELARIVTLGLTGFDSPVRGASIEEARHAMVGLARTLAPYRADIEAAAPTLAARLDSLVALADAQLAAGDFEIFDRLSFIVAVANPLAHTIADARDALGISVPSEPRFWRATAATLFEADAFDADFLRPVMSPRTTPQLAALGHQLFFDPALSGNGTRSCASCHQPERGFTDGLKVSAAMPGDTTTLRNAPTIINAALQGAQFADMRAVFLEDQVTDVVSNVAEMHGVLETAAGRLAAEPAYTTAFSEAFRGAPDTGISPRTIRVALAAYMRSLQRLDSRVDRALRGDTAQLTAEERLGFNVFAGKGACATCHFLPLTNGTVPPFYTKTEQEVLGVPSRAVWTKATVDPDEGRARSTRAPLHRFAFKTPTVRNAAVTAPYMHNGVYRTLEEVVRFYELGGGQGIGIDLPHKTLPFANLDLTPAETQALVAFMKAFTDTTRTTARPVR